MRHLARTFGCCRFVYNWALATRKQAYFGEGKSLYYNDLAARLPALKAAYPFLAEVSSVPIQLALRHIGTFLKASRPAAAQRPMAAAAQ